MLDLATIPEQFRADIERAIALVRDQGAQEVYIFGSLIDPWENELPRDIDIAVSGLPPEKFFHTYGLLLGELNHPFDLIDLDDDSRFVRKLRERGRFERVA
ncbi:MAG: hypothetical protein R6V29_02050 [Spirochaetia bacterium]